MAGIAAAATNNALGIAGLNWEARLMPVKVLDQNGGGDVNRVAQGITWAVDQGARVVNLSFDGPEPAPPVSWSGGGFSKLKRLVRFKMGPNGFRA